MIPAAFFAPLKAPDHPVPSGDREIGRSLLSALRLAGFSPDVASDLRCLDLKGDSKNQAELCGLAEAAIPALIARGRAAGWRLWLTYHNYYKAPDLLGPKVSRALGIPYVQVESTRARKRLEGPWSEFAAEAEAASNAARTIFHFTERDRTALHAYAPEGQMIRYLAPFLDRARLPPRSDLSGPLLTVAMMRPGDKLASYRLIAETLSTLPHGDWRLDVAGDGATRREVERLMKPFRRKVRFLGKLDRAALDARYRTARALFWPGVGEAIGMTYLEAQAAGIPVLAQNRAGLREVLAPGTHAPEVEAGALGLATALEDLLLQSPDPCRLRNHIRKRHLRPVAAATLRAALLPLLAPVE